MILYICFDSKQECAASLGGDFFLPAPVSQIWRVSSHGFQARNVAQSELQLH